MMAEACHHAFDPSDIDCSNLHTSGTIHDDQASTKMHFQATICAFLLCGSALLQPWVEGFATPSHPSTASSSALTATATSGRRAFLDVSLTTAASILLISQPALADGESVDDLSMPTEDEVKKAEVSF
jgi:hypothetical protein